MGNEHWLGPLLGDQLAWERLPPQYGAESDRRNGRGLQDDVPLRGFKKAVAALTEGIADFDAYAKLRGHLQAAARASPGSIGAYHMHMVFTVLVASDWVAARVVDWWPVSESAGTMQGLRCIYGAGLTGKAAPGALRELWRRLAGSCEAQR